MTQPQIFAFGIIAGMMALFIWGRLRYDLVAILALLASIAAGTVPAKDAFSGFGDDIVIIVWSALIVSTAVARSGIIETALAGSDRTRRGAAVAAGASHRDRRDAVGHRQEYRRIGHADACGAPDGEKVWRVAVAVPDADGLRLPARRPGDPRWHIAEHHRFARARADRRPTFRHVRLRACRARAGGGRARLPRARLPAHPQRAARGADHGRGAEHRGIHH